MEYRVYRLSSRELASTLFKAVGITGVIMLLFYRSFWAILFFPVVYFLELHLAKKTGVEARRLKLQEEFLHGISVLNSSLQAGLSMENAWKEVEKETKFLYGSSSEFYLELKEINQMVAHNQPIEKLFLEFAYKCKVEEVIQFAELLEFGKRSGSNWKRIIEVSVGQMTERYEAMQQIEVMVAEKKMEQQVMNIIPLALLAFLQFSAWDYMAVLYHNWFGVICMTIFLIAYVVIIALAQKILKVQL